MKGLAVVSNLNSGANRRGPKAVEAVEAVARRHGIAHAATRDPDELEPALRRFAEHGVETLAVNGGDGTMDAVLAVIRNKRIFPREPRFALLRGGTTNMLHDDFGLGGPPARALARTVAACQGERAAGRLLTRRVLAVRHGDSPPALGFFFGTAAIPRAIRMARERLHARGLAGPTGDAMAFAWLILRLLAGRVEDDPVLHPQSLARSLDGAPWRKEATVLLLATTLERLLLGLRPIQPGDGFGAAGLDWPCRRLWWRLPAFLRGRGRDAGDGLWRARGDRLALSGASAYTLDGELYEADPDVPLELEAGEAARFLVV